MALNSIPRQINPRSVWHWATVNDTVSVMAAAVETGRLGIQRQPSGMSGGWKKTKPGKTDFGGYSDNSRSIWWENQRMQVRLIIAQLPFNVRAVGTVLYGDFGAADLMQAHNHLYRVCMPVVDEQFPNMAPERKGKVRDLIYCALCHYHEAISPCFDGGRARSMDPDLKQLRALMTGRGQNIETRYWSREWRPVWALIIEKIQDVDQQGLARIEEWIDEYFDKREWA